MCYNSVFHCIRNHKKSAKSDSGSGSWSRNHDTPSIRIHATDNFRSETAQRIQTNRQIPSLSRRSVCNALDVVVKCGGVLRRGIVRASEEKTRQTDREPDAVADRQTERQRRSHFSSSVIGVFSRVARAVSKDYRVLR